MATMPNEVKAYLEALYRGCDKGHIVFVEPCRNKVSAVFDVKRLDLAAKHIEREPLNLFMKINVMDHEATKRRNAQGVGGRDEVAAIVSLHLDVDAGKDDRYLTPQKMLDALEAMPLPPSMIIQSNGDDGGFHPYWLLDEPHYITDEADRQYCQNLATRWLTELREHAKPGTIDGTANIDRILRPVGSLRTTGNYVRPLIFNPARRYRLSQFALPDIAQPVPIYNSEPRHDGESIIEKYLDAVGLNSVEAILSRQGYSHVRDNFWIRPGSQSGAPTGEIFNAKDGRRGFTVKSGGADPLDCQNANGSTGRWYSVAALYVAFSHGGDWKKAAREAYEFFEPLKPKTDLSNFMNAAPAQAIHTAAQQEKPSQKTITIKARRMDTVIAEKIDWWWPNKIPKANLIIFAGQGGCGKSSVCVDLVARHTTGLPFPNDSTVREPENVAIINCEDDAATIQRPRLDAAGADCSRVYLLDALDLGGDELWIDFSNHARTIEQFIIDNKITLLVVDPISGHIGGKKQNDTAEVREVLQKLQAMAKRTHCTIIAITHSPKNSSSAQSSIIGSQAFVSCARAAFAFVVDRNDSKRRIMLNAKSNYSADETGLAYHIENVDGIGRVEWEADPVTDHPDSFFTPHGGSKDTNNQSAVDHAAGLLAAFLEEAKPKKEIDVWAKAQMITSATLRRAKDKNGHVAEKRADGWYWLPMVNYEHWNG